MMRGRVENLSKATPAASARSKDLSPIENQKLCEWCGVEPCKRPAAKFCSLRCSQLSQRTRERTKCETCGVVFEPDRSGRRYCSRQCGSGRPARLTPEERRVNAKRFRDAWRRSHPDEVKSARGYYRALRKGAYVEKLDIRTIYKRDKGICGICCKTVARADSSLDHIQPISRGGVHAAYNVRISHLACNLSRGNRGAAQLRMAIT